MSKLLWEPSEERVQDTNIYSFIEAANNKFNTNIKDYLEKIEDLSRVNVKLLHQDGDLNFLYTDLTAETCGRYLFDLSVANEIVENTSNETIKLPIGVGIPLKSKHIIIRNLKVAFYLISNRRFW